METEEARPAAAMTSMASADDGMPMRDRNREVAPGKNGAPRAPMARAMGQPVQLHGLA